MPIPLALPLDDDIIPLCKQHVFLDQCRFVHLLEVTVWMVLGMTMTIRITFGAPVLQATVKFVDGARHLVIPVD